jgi:glutamate-1-semialdehyde aminotransferase
MLYQRSSQLLLKQKKIPGGVNSPVRALEQRNPIFVKVRKALIYMMKMETV